MNEEYIMAEHETIEIDPQELQKAEALWGHFVTGVKYVSIASALTLILLALAFVEFS